MASTRNTDLEHDGSPLSRISRRRPNGPAGQQLRRPALLLLLGLVAGLQLAGACHQARFGQPDNICCLCNATHCDRVLDFEWPARDDSAFVRLVSSRAGARFQQSLLRPTEEPARAEPPQVVDYLLEVQVNRRRQQVVGFGGAFTDSASKLLEELEGGVRARALEDYFGPTGLRYNLGRVPIGGTDMSSRPYSYDDLPAGLQQDLELRHFRLQPEDLLYKVPMIRRANELRESSLRLGPLKLMAASWSAPPWMKSNHHLVQGRLKGNSSSEPYYDAYARYQIRFLHEYERLNLTMWALSPQNEPYTPKRVGPLKINFNSVNFEPHEMADYLAGSLVPNLVRAGKTPDKLKLFIWDDTLDGLASYQREALSSHQVSNFTLGLAIHWYTTGLREKPYRLLYEARRRLPARYSLISTEASFIGRPRPGDWERGERYARDLIENLRAGSVGWIDWNLALNMSGGPTWSHNILDAAVLVDPQANTYYRNPMFYALGHVSRFIEANSHVVESRVHGGGGGAHNSTGTGSERPEEEPDDGEQQELALVAAELEEPLRVEGQLKRRLGLVVLNRAQQVRRARLLLRECHLKRAHRPLELELPASSVTSLAFVC